MAYLNGKGLWGSIEMVNPTTKYYPSHDNNAAEVRPYLTIHQRPRKTIDVTSVGSMRKG